MEYQEMKEIPKGVTCLEWKIERNGRVIGGVVPLLANVQGETLWEEVCQQIPGSIRQALAEQRSPFPSFKWITRKIPGVAMVTIQAEDAERFSRSRQDAEIVLNAKLRQISYSVFSHLSHRWRERPPDKIQQIAIIVDDQRWNNFDELARSLK